MNHATRDIQELRAQLEECHPSSFTWTLSCCGRDPAMAEEILQEVYLKIMEGKARFGGRATFKTWLFAVIRKTAAEERRRRLFQRLRFFRLEETDERLAEDARVEEMVHQSEMQGVFLRALEKISRRQQEVLHLVFYQDLTLEETAKVLHISIGSVRTHYERGKKRLRQQLENAKDFHELRPSRQLDHRAVTSAQTRG